MRHALEFHRMRPRLLRPLALAALAASLLVVPRAGAATAPRGLEGDPSPDPYQGNSTTGAKNYADRHDPFLYFPDVIGNATRCAAHQRPFTDLAGDLRLDALPAFSFITPDTCNDGHDNPCAGRNVGG